MSFEFGKQFGSANYTPALSNVDYITQDNMFICFGLIVKDQNGNAKNIASLGILSTELGIFCND